MREGQVERNEWKAVLVLCWETGIEVVDLLN